MIEASVTRKPYAPIYTPIKVGGRCYIVPSDFASGLRFLKRFLKRTSVIEFKVHFVGGKSYALTNNLVVDYEIGDKKLPDLSFNPGGIEAITSFAISPDYLRVDGYNFCFQWKDGQELCVDASGEFIGGKEIFRGNSHYNEYAHHAFDRFWQFREGVNLALWVDRARLKFSGSRQSVSRHPFSSEPRPGTILNQRLPPKR